MTVFDSSLDKPENSLRNRNKVTSYTNIETISYEKETSTTSTVSISTSSSSTNLDDNYSYSSVKVTSTTDSEGHKDVFMESFKIFKERERPSHTMTYVSIHEVDKVYRSTYIKHGYRFSSSFYHTFLSLFELHNETMNIWSHLLGFFFVLYVSFNIYFLFNPVGSTVRYLPLPSPKGAMNLNELIFGVPEEVLQERMSTYNNLIAQDKDYVDEFPWLEFGTFNLYLICASTCLILSAIYHWFSSISVTIHNCLLKIDLSGVAILVAGSYVPSIYYGFYCFPGLQHAYLIFAGIILVLGLIAPWVNYEIKGHPVRPFLLASLAVAGIIPGYHWYKITPSYFITELSFGYFYLFFWYGLGFLIYKFHFPQILFRHKVVDNIIPSHALWHACVVCAIYVWFVYLMRYHEILPEHGCRDF